MNTIFMNSKNSKTSDSSRLLLNLTDKIVLINIFLFQTLACTIHRKYKKSHMRTINLKYQLQHGMKNLNYVTDHILYQIFKIILNIFKKKQGEKTVNPSVRI